MKTHENSRVNEAELSQPLCTMVQVALLDLIISWGIWPQAVVGHSSGEICASYATGAISRESAWRISYWRGKDPGNVKGPSNHVANLLLARKASC